MSQQVALHAVEATGVAALVVAAPLPVAERRTMLREFGLLLTRLEDCRLQLLAETLEVV